MSGNKPVGSLLAKPKNGVESAFSPEGKSFKVGAVWPVPFTPREHQMFNVTIGDREVDTLDAIDVLASGDYFISVILYDED